MSTPFLEGGCEMGALIRSRDWTQTPLGAPDSWPQSLKIAVRILLTSRYAMWMGWGPELAFFYNDAAGRIQGAVLRLPDFYGPGVDKSFLHGAIMAATHGGSANMIGPLDRPHEFVFVPDVGPVVCRLVEMPGAWGHVWHLAGAGATTQQVIVDEIVRQSGQPLKTRVAGKTLLRLIGLFDPTMREMVEMHYLLIEPVILDGTALEKLIGPIARTPYPEGIRQALAAARATAALPG